MAALDFWYEFGSTYSYPAAMRIERLAEAAHVKVRWRPFLLGPIFKAYGWNDSPFNIYAAKGRYMWRDLQRICEAEELPPKLPPVRFPQNGLKAARLALVGERQSWTPAFSRAVFVANYAEQKDISDDTTLRAILAALGVDAEAALVAANGAGRCRCKLPRPVRGACSACPFSPSATNCSGATTGSRRGSPGRHVRRTTCCATMPHRLICVDIDHVEAHLSTSIASREKPND
jgi:2-hydroxychromene-2-carboxylate isomerase